MFVFVVHVYVLWPHVDLSVKHNRPDDSQFGRETTVYCQWRSVDDVSACQQIKNKYL